MNQDNPINGDNLAKAKYTIDNCEEILSNKIIRKSIEAGLETSFIDKLCKIINEAIQDYKIEKESAMKFINDQEISDWIKEYSNPKDKAA